MPDQSKDCPQTITAPQTIKAKDREFDALLRLAAQRFQPLKVDIRKRSGVPLQGNRGRASA